MRTTMRIGVDAKRLRGKFGGLNVYTRTLVGELCALGHDVRLITDRPIPAEDLPSPTAGFPSRVGPIKFRRLWDKLVLPAMSARMELDVLHYPVGFVGSERGKCPQVVTIHDLLPIVVPGFYTKEEAAELLGRLKTSVRRCDAVITVSEHVKADVVNMLDVGDKPVVPVPLAARDFFMRLPPDGDIVARRRELGLPDHYVLCVVSSGGMHKNASKAVEALRALPSPVRAEMSLVVVGRENREIRKVRVRTEELGILDRVHFAGEVDDEALRVIYNLASVFVLPSVNEGFGLPILEAMACGTPVVTGDRGAMKEVAGDAALLVDPNDHEAIADAITRMFEDGAARDDLIARGLARAAQFSWRRTAEMTAEVFASVSH